MIIFLCEPSYEGILSGIYDAGISKIPKNELRLELKRIPQSGSYLPITGTVNPRKTSGKVRKTIGKSCLQRCSNRYIWLHSARIRSGQISYTVT